MDLTELTNLIAIRQYVVNATGNFSIDNPTAHYLNKALSFLDKKIVATLTGDEFKQYIGYVDPKKSVVDIKPGILRHEKQ